MAMWVLMSAILILVLAKSAKSAQTEGKLGETPGTPTSVHVDTADVAASGDSNSGNIPKLPWRIEYSPVWKNETQEWCHKYIDGLD